MLMIYEIEIFKEYAKIFASNFPDFISSLVLKAFRSEFSWRSVSFRIEVLVYIYLLTIMSIK